MQEYASGILFKRLPSWNIKKNRNVEIKSDEQVWIYAFEDSLESGIIFDYREFVRGTTKILIKQLAEWMGMESLNQSSTTKEEK